MQQAPSTPFAKAPSRVVIPKRGEKDFEPLNETQTIQEKMLRESRQALFDGLSGVRGTSRYVVRISLRTRRGRKGLEADYLYDIIGVYRQQAHVACDLGPHSIP